VKDLELRYVGHVITITNSLRETYSTYASTLRELIAELAIMYSGFQEVFINKDTEQLNLAAMIYYGDADQAPFVVVDLGQAIQDGAQITFW